jgi:geranylgeranylglycerol-phosphate geranylgeranyltransferase
MNLKDFARLTRIEHSFFLAIAVIIGEVVVTRDIQLLPTLAGVLSVFFIGIGSFAINDALDYKIDKANKRLDRPIVTGKISLKTAKLIANISFPIGVVLALAINSVCFLIALLFAVFAIVYSYNLKKSFLVGNVFIAFSMAVPLVFGNYIVSEELDMAVLILASMAFLTGLGREIIKDIQDIAGDKKYGATTVPVVLGKKTASWFASFYVLIAVALSPIPFLLLQKYVYNWLYLAPIIVTDLLLLASIAYSLKLKKLETVRKMSLLALGMGLAGFLLGAL